MGERANFDGSAWTDPNSNLWRDLRLHVRVRLASAMAHLLATGRLNRADIRRIGEVSEPQAATDIRMLLERTGALAYDHSAKHYRLKDKAA